MVTSGVPRSVEGSGSFGLIPEKTRLGSEMDAVGVTKGDGRSKGTDLVDVGLADSLISSSLIGVGTFDIGAAIDGKFSDIFASRSGRNRDSPPRRFEIRFKN